MKSKKAAMQTYASYGISFSVTTKEFMEHPEKVHSSTHCGCVD